MCVHAELANMRQEKYVRKEIKLNIGKEKDRTKRPTRRNARVQKKENKAAEKGRRNTVRGEYKQQELDLRKQCR